MSSIAAIAFCYPASLKYMVNELGKSNRTLMEQKILT
jgi:hypothetical protein